mmetsp:Transcript_29590/g.47074  ORF Transcript_29590/g.47074 Transcript_29590/m.47074 type:complete len:228 (-) Transcript_29590:1570-2253(-)
MEATKREQLERIHQRLTQLAVRIRRSLFIANIMNQQSSHHLQRGSLIHHLHRLEQMHSTVRRRKLCIMHNRLRGRRRRHIAAHNMSFMIRKHCAPMLHTLRQRIIRTLSHCDAIHNVQLLVFALHRLHSFVVRLTDQLTTKQRVQHAHPRRKLTRCVIISCCGIRLLWKHVIVRGRAQKRDVYLVRLSLLAQTRNNRIARQRQLNMQRAIQVGIISNGDLLVRLHRF